MFNYSEDRKAREKQFHNQRYCNNQRRVLTPVSSFVKYTKVLLIIL